MTALGVHGLEVGGGGGLRPGSCRAAGRRWSGPEGEAAQVLGQREVSQEAGGPQCDALRGQS